jgi:hypothetical protein
MRYGADAYQLLVKAALAEGAEMTIAAATASALAPMVPRTAKLRRCTFPPPEPGKKLLISFIVRDNTPPSI